MNVTQPHRLRRASRRLPTTPRSDSPRRHRSPVRRVLGQRRSANNNGLANTTTFHIKNFNIAGKFVATRVFFVGEDPVTCTGFTP